MLSSVYQKQPLLMVSLSQQWITVLSGYYVVPNIYIGFEIHRMKTSALFPIEAIVLIVDTFSFEGLSMTYRFVPLWIHLRRITHSSPPSAAYMHQSNGSALVQIMAYSAPSHYVDQCWHIVKWTRQNKLQWNFNQNTKHFTHENASKYISSVKWRPFCPGEMG